LTFCNPNDSSRVTDPFMVMLAGTQRSSSASAHGRKRALRPVASGTRRRGRNKLKSRDVERWRMVVMFIVLSFLFNSQESEPSTKGPFIRERPGRCTRRCAPSLCWTFLAFFLVRETHRAPAPVRQLIRAAVPYPSRRGRLLDPWAFSQTLQKEKGCRT